MFKFFSGLTFIGVSFFIALGYVKADLQSKPLNQVLVFTLVVLIPLSVGFWLVYSHRSDRRHLQEERDRIISSVLKTTILDLAQRSNGRLSLEEMVTTLKVHPRLVQHTLDLLITDRLVELEVTKSDNLVYVFTYSEYN